MGLILIGGYYDKTEALKILLSMKYYKRNLEPFQSAEEYAAGKGIFGIVAAYEEKMHEDYLVEKMLVVKSILEKQGNDAIDAFEELTSPNENFILSPIKNFFSDDKELVQILDELSIPMKKEEFYHYLDIYNQFSENKILENIIE